MRKRLVVSTIAALAGAALCVPPSLGAELAYLGVWTVASSAPAPWAQAGEMPVASDLKALIGRAVTFAPDRITAPKPLACRKPHYEVKAYAADMLFQGGLSDPAPQAAALGFAGRTVPTLETGCEGAIDFHFTGPTRAMFALNNRIYLMIRSR